MDLEKEYLRALFIESQKGYWLHKKLAELYPHDGSCSEAGHCICELVYNKLFPEPPPNPEPVYGEDYIKDSNGIITMNGSAALTGDYAHDNTQRLLGNHPDFIAAERGFKLKEDGIIELGLIDLELTDTKTGKPVRTIVDIKGCGSRTFFYAAGKYKCNAWTYTYWKIKNTKVQSNEYALGCPYYGVMWINLESWGQFKLEWFPYDVKMHQDVMRKRKRVKGALKKIVTHENIREGIKKHMPPIEGNCYCELGQDGMACYCRHYKDGTTGDFPKKSGANCPGKTKLTQRKENVDLLKLKEDLEDFEGDY